MRAHFGSRFVGPGEVLGDSTLLPCALIEEWLLGSDDPLNLPFLLFMERFSVPGQERGPEGLGSLKILR